MFCIARNNWIYISIIIVGLEFFVERNEIELYRVCVFQLSGKCPSSDVSECAIQGQRTPRAAIQMRFTK